MVMLGQRYTTPIVIFVCPVTKLHHKASLQSASSCNCTSYAAKESRYSKIKIANTCTEIDSVDRFNFGCNGIIHCNDNTMSKRLFGKFVISSCDK